MHIYAYRVNLSPEVADRLRYTHVWARTNDSASLRHQAALCAGTMSQKHIYIYILYMSDKPFTRGCR